MPSRRTVPAWASAPTALALLLGALLPLAAVATAGPAQAVVHRTDAATAAADADPLSVSIDRLTPSTLKDDPARGTVRVAGTVTNDDTQTWQSLNVYAFIGSTPLTTETELAEAAISDPSAQGGIERITTYGEFATLPDLAPGASADFEIAIPRADLHGDTFGPPTASGVYWFGVQVLGTSADGARDGLADGRARTFLPLVARPGHVKHPVRAAIVVPLRQRVLRQPDGSVASVAHWARELAPGGRLWDLLDFAGGHQVSWLIDPALIDAVKQLADGNAPRSIAPTDGSEQGGKGGTPTQSPSPTHTATVSRSLARTVDPTAATAPAKAWLAHLLPVLKQSPAVYALPYGDLDLSAAARNDPGLYAVARDRGAAALSALGITALPLDVPTTGYVQPDAIRLGESTTPLLLSDRAISGGAPPVATIAGRTVFTTSSLVAAGGPTPGRQVSPVPMRQELLAQVSMRLASGAPVLAVLPFDWSAGADAGAAGTDLFNGLDLPWLDLTTVTSAVEPVIERDVDPARLHYPDAELGAELPPTVFHAVSALRASGTTLQSVLPHNDAVAAVVLDDALTSASYTARGGNGASGTAADRSRAVIESQLHSITVTAPPSVTLASDHGKFNATVVNHLDQPVQVKVKAITDGELTVGGSGRLEIPAGRSAGVLLSATAHANGIHHVVLRLTTIDGKPLGSQDAFPIRAAQVSRIIWLFIGGGLGLLFAAIVVRLVRRIRNRLRGGPAVEAP